MLGLLPLRFAVGPILRVRQRRMAAAIAQLGERQTEDLKVHGSIPGLCILSRSCLGVHLVSCHGLVLFGYRSLSGTMRFSCFDNIACQAGFLICNGSGAACAFLPGCFHTGLQRVGRFAACMCSSGLCRTLALKLVSGEGHASLCSELMFS